MADTRHDPLPAAPASHTGRRIRTLLFSSLYPSSVRPGHGIFVETRLRELLATGQVETRVVAPVPWFFSRHPRFGEYARLASTPRCELHNGIEVLHPRYGLLPKLGMTLAPFSMALAALPTLRRLQREGFDFDLIDAHYYYPDGVAAALLARWLGKPLVVTARGSDINLIPAYRLPRRLIRWAATVAQASITVSQALGEQLARLVDDPSRLQVLRNGVDLARFHPIAPAQARQHLGWPDQPTLISVGNLVENKGHHIAIEALARLPAFRLVIVGRGPELATLQRLAQAPAVAGRVSFTGAVDQHALATLYSAADILILASSREGWPNVLLESMACGTPVVATALGGIPEVVAEPVAGRLTPQRTADGFVSLIEALWQDYPDRAAVRRYAERFSWAETSEGQLALFRAILARQPLVSNRR